VVRKLGLAPLDQRFGESTGDILLDDVDCEGSESSLADCEHAEWGDHDCAQWEYVSIVCVDNVNITGNKLETTFNYS